MNSRSAAWIRRRERARAQHAYEERRVRLYVLRIIGAGHQIPLFEAVKFALKAVLFDGAKDPSERLVREWIAKMKRWAAHAASWFSIEKRGHSLLVAASLFGAKAYASHFARRFAKPARVKLQGYQDKKDINNRHPKGVRRPPGRRRPPAAGICALAAYLARKPLAFEHDTYPRVAYSFPHAFNFAVRWLQARIDRDVIVEHYTRALRQRHITASDLLTTWSPSSTVSLANQSLEAHQRGLPYPAPAAPAPKRDLPPRPPQDTKPRVPSLSKLAPVISQPPDGWYDWLNSTYPDSKYSRGGIFECAVWSQLPDYVRKLVSDGMA